MKVLDTVPSNIFARNKGLPLKVRTLSNVVIDFAYIGLQVR